MEFLKGFFREGTPESSARLVMIMCATTVNLMCATTITMFFVSEKDFSNQCALLSGLLLTIAGGVKTFQKGKEAPQLKE